MYEGALTKEARRLFPLFGKFKNFYLVGGTALALQIGHRLSADFDFFSNQELLPNLLPKVRRVFSNSSIKVSYRISSEQLTVLIDGTKTTFFYYPYSLVEPLLEYLKVPLASILEIAAMKAFSIGKRISYKDYIDWYFLFSEKHVKLKQVIETAQKKFNGDFNARLFLGQLASISDVPTLDIDFLRDPVDRKTVEKFLEKTIRDFKF